MNGRRDTAAAESTRHEDDEKLLGIGSIKQEPDLNGRFVPMSQYVYVNKYVCMRVLAANIA